LPLGPRVADHGPVGRRVDGEPEVRLEVGLVEAGEDPLGVVKKALRVEVDLAVGRVDEAVQALTRAAVRAPGADDELVVGVQGGQVEPVARQRPDRVPVKRRLDQLAVQLGETRRRRSARSPSSRSAWSRHR
jgi:hypothetical protein